eukprot:TRINITY_DN19012_c0_g1_i1.p1 TRINITY_DN19012_c0_g1~~TRINITY_DN19012_c0_g1_i1.p1  ORF type:complete len:517 (+),score=90.14 TRINITY_DN19012_c0_g1_i1:46-1596(+)
MGNDKWCVFLICVMLATSYSSILKEDGVRLNHKRVKSLLFKTPKDSSNNSNDDEPSPSPTQLCDFSKHVKGTWEYEREPQRYGMPIRWKDCWNIKSCASALPWFDYAREMKERLAMYGNWVAREGFPIFKPATCRMTYHNPTETAKILSGRKLFIVGDSTGDDHFRHLVAVLSQESLIPDLGPEKLYNLGELPGVGNYSIKSYKSDGLNCVFIRLTDTIACWVGIRAGKLQHPLNPASAYRFVVSELNATKDDIILMSPGLHYYKTSPSLAEVIEETVTEYNANVTDGKPMLLFREMSPQFFEKGQYNARQESSYSQCCTKAPLASVTWDTPSEYDWGNPDIEKELSKQHIPLLKVFSATLLQNATDMKRGDCLNPGEVRTCLRAECFGKECVTQDGTHFIVGGHSHHFWTSVLTHYLAVNLLPLSETRDMRGELENMVASFLNVNDYVKSGVKHRWHIGTTAPPLPVPTVSPTPPPQVASVPLPVPPPVPAVVPVAAYATHWVHRRRIRVRRRVR